MSTITNEYDQEEKQQLNCDILENSNNIQFDVCFKLLVLGDANVGKSCLINTAVNKNFDINSQYNPTLGFEYFSLNLLLNGVSNEERDQLVKIKIWDTCGQEIYRSLFSNFYKGATMAILVFSLDDKDSFNHMGFWMKELKSNSGKDCICFIIGNKSDKKILVNTNEINKFLEKYNINKDYYFETTCYEKENVKNVFLESAKLMYKLYLKYKKNGELSIKFVLEDDNKSNISYMSHISNTSTLSKTQKLKQKGESGHSCPC